MPSRRARRACCGRPTTPARRNGRRAGGSTLVALLVLLGSVLGGAPASAHDGLEESAPSDGQVLTTEPAQVVLTFTAAQLGVGTAVAVTGPDGEAWSEGDAVVDGAVVTQPLRPGMPAGAYVVEWRSVSSDGHPIDGTFTFTVDVAPVAEPTPEPSPTSDATAEPAPDQTPAATTAPEDGSEDAVAGPWLLAAAAAALVAMGVAAVAVLVRMRRGGFDA